MSEITLAPLTRPYKPVGGFAYFFEQILSKSKRGILPEDSIQYFMIYAKRVYQKADYKERVIELENLLDEWNYWINVKRRLQQKQYDLPILLEYEKYVKLSLDYINFSRKDFEIRNLSMENERIFQEYVTSLIEMRIEELFFYILSKICIIIYADNLLKEGEIARLVQNVREREIREREIVTLETEYEIDEESDVEKLKRTRHRTDINLQRVLNLIQRFLQELRMSFIRVESINAKINISKIYTFTLLLVAEQTLENNDLIKVTVNHAFEIVKQINQYKFLRKIRRFKLKDFEELYLKYENKLENMLQQLFDITENITSQIKGSGEKGLYLDFGEDELKSVIITYRLDRKTGLTQKEKDHLVGLRLRYDDLESVIEMEKAGEKYRSVEVGFVPYVITARNLPPLTLITGKMGSGKTIMGINIVRSLLKDNYCVVDISNNPERPAEMCFCSIPLIEKYYKKEYKKLREIQNMDPEKLNVIILVPYYKTLRFKELPSCARIVTVPLHTLAKKRYALKLLLTKFPEKGDDVIALLDLILSEKADEHWDLDSLRYYLRNLMKSKKQISIWIEEKIGSLRYKRKIVIDRQAVKRLLKLLVPSSPLISNGITRTALNFDEILKPGVLVTTYLGHIPDKSDCFAFITYLFYSLIEYKKNHPEKKIAIYCNEAQTVAPSMSLLGGTWSSETYRLSVDIATEVLNLRGLGLPAIFITQQPMQLKDQIRSQSHLIIAFHTTKDDDIKFILGDITNEEFKKNLEILIKNKLFKDEHLCIFKWGTETDAIHIVASVMCPCAVERTGIDFFKLYKSLYPADTVSVDLYVKMLEEAKIESFKKTIEHEIGKTIEIIEDGSQKLVAINPEEDIVVKKDKLTETIGVGKDKVVVDKRLLENLDKKIILDIEIPDVGDLKKLSTASFYKTVFYHLAFGLEDFEFKVTPYRGKTKPEPEELRNIPVLQDIMNSLGFYSNDFRTSYHPFKKLYEKDSTIQKLFGKKIIYQRHVYYVNKETRKEIEDRLDLETKKQIFGTCYYHLYPRNPNLNWRKEVVNFKSIFNKNCFENSKYKTQTEVKDNKT